MKRRIAVAAMLSALMLLHAMPYVVGTVTPAARELLAQA